MTNWVNPRSCPQIEMHLGGMCKFDKSAYLVYDYVWQATS